MKWLASIFGKGSKPPAAANAEPPALPVIDPKSAPSQGFAQPHFRFFPGCYASGGTGEPIFRQEEGPCHACGMRDIWRYCRSVYWIRRDEPTICARCVADGNLVALLPDGAPNYGFHDCELEGADWRDPVDDEIDRRTPGFDTFNPFTWPMLDGQPLAFMGHGDEEKWKYVPQALAALTEANGGENPFPSPYFLLFKEVDGTRYRAIVDL